jgi:hypothetical protein
MWKRGMWEQGCESQEMTTGMRDVLSGPWGQKAAGYRACWPGTADVAIS